jgi:hypothetical protein
MAQPSSPIFQLPEPAGLDAVVYDLVYYGTRQGLIEFFSIGAKVEGRTRIAELVENAVEGKITPLIYTTDTGQMKFFAFRVFAEPVIENIYSGIRQVIRFSTKE